MKETIACLIALVMIWGCTHLLGNQMANGGAYPDPKTAQWSGTTILSPLAEDDQLWNCHINGNRACGR
jgi:hypothetical protein